MCLLSVFSQWFPALVGSLLLTSWVTQNTQYLMKIANLIAGSLLCSLLFCAS